jgi:hypothetical protein
VLNNLGGALERTHLGDASHVVRADSELHTELKIFVWIVPQMLLRQLRHDRISSKELFGNCWPSTMSAPILSMSPAHYQRHNGLSWGKST